MIDKKTMEGLREATLKNADEAEAFIVAHATSEDHKEELYAEMWKIVDEAGFLDD